MSEHITFVSYTGGYPNLCSGILTLKIDGKEVKFGWDYLGLEKDNCQKYFLPFWCSGGGCYSDWSGAYQNEWRFDFDDIPEKYQKYADEIAEVFNENVPWGCCGGCI